MLLDWAGSGMSFLLIDFVYKAEDKQANEKDDNSNNSPNVGGWDEGQLDVLVFKPRMWDTLLGLNGVSITDLVLSIATHL